MIPYAGNTANNDPSTAPPQRDALDTSVSMSSTTLPDSAVADNTPVTTKSNVSISGHPMDDNIDHLSSAEKDEDSNHKIIPSQSRAANKKIPPQIHAANKKDKSLPPIVYDLGKMSSVPPRPSHPTPKQISTDDTFEDNVPVYLHGDDHFSSSRHEHGAPLDLEGGGNTHDRKVTTGIFPDAENLLPKKGDSPCIGGTSVPPAVVNFHPKDDETALDNTSTSRNKKDHHPPPIYDLGASSLPKRSTKISKRARGLFGRIPAYSQDKKKPATNKQQLINASCSLSYYTKGDKEQNVVDNGEVNKTVCPLEMTVESQKLKVQELEEAEKNHTNNGLYDRADGTMFVKLSDFDTLKMKLEELEMSQRKQKESQEAQRREMEQLKMLQRAQKEEIETQKQRIQELEAAHEEDQALLPVEIPHAGADNSSPTHEMSSTFPSGHGQTFWRRRMSSIFRNYHIVSNSRGGENGNTLESDTFSLMMISKVWSRSWALGIIAYSFQIVLGAMIASDQITLSTDSSVFSVPFKVRAVVRVGQFLTIILCLSTQSDILTSVRSVLLLSKGSAWDEVIGETGHKSTSLWIIRILIPNLLKSTQGLLVTFVSFVIIVQSDDIIDLLKDFTALMVLSETDNILFDLAGYGYLGEELMDQVAKVSDIKVPQESIDPTSSSPSTRRCQMLHSPFCIRYLVLLCLSGLMMGGWITIVVNQLSGKYFRDRYPKCNFTEAFRLAKKHFGDGTCYGGPLNSLECAFEGGDCIDFNIAYPLCKGRDNLTDVQSSVRNGTCEEVFMIAECDYDGGDCCPLEIVNSPLFGDNQCHGGTSNTAQCGFDNGDCNIFNAAYPKCPLAELGDIEGAEDFVLGDGVCDGIYSSEECGWENGDCDVGQIGQDLIADYYGHIPSGVLLVGRKRTMGILSDGVASVYRYSHTEKRWNPLGNLPTRDGETTLGFAISINHAGEDRIAIMWSSGQASVYDYVASNQSWVQVGQNINRGGFDDVRIDMTADGSRLVISDYHVGEVYVFELIMADNRWDLVGKVIEKKADGEHTGDIFTHINSDNGNTVTFSIDHNAVIMTRIYRYDQDSQDWMQLGSDIPSPGARSSAISCNGTRIAVSCNADTEEYPGEVKVFDYDEMDNSWVQVGATIMNGQSSDGNHFGDDIDMSSDGNILTISCDNCDTGSVQIYVFDSYYYKFIPAYPRSSRNGNIIVDKDRDRDNIWFGLSLSISGDGSTLSVSGENIPENNIFVRVYDLDQLFYIRCVVDDPDMLGDDSCDDEYPYNSAECGFDFGDCPLPSPVEDYPGCMVSYPEKIGNGECNDWNHPMYNSTECGYDGGDCFPQPVDGYPGCFVLHPYHVGDGECDSWWDNYTTVECGYDGGDCLPKPVDGYPGCLVPDTYRIGNGECDSWRDQSYNSTECGYDGGDCLP